MIRKFIKWYPVKMFQSIPRNMSQLALFLFCVNTWGLTTISTIRPRRVLCMDSLKSSSIDIIGTTSRTESGKINETSIYLFSLQWTPDHCISKPVRDLWKWKDEALGDGRDFFTPKPKTITALQDYFRMHAELEECSILSNCARFEILCTATYNPIQELASCIIAQMEGSSNLSLLWQKILTGKMDLPELYLNTNSLPPTVSERSRELAKYWEQKEGTEAILHHLSLVAAGIASRPRRPDRETIFQPFSSRDAHILLQLKRTKEVAEGPTINRILEFALRAGKAARNPKIVPEVEKLRPYSKYSSEAPRILSKEVAQAAIEKAVVPLLHECLDTFQALELSEAIVQLRYEAEKLANNPSELQWIRKRLHQPTMDLRRGLSFDRVAFLQTIETELADGMLG